MRHLFHHGGGVKRISSYTVILSGFFIVFMVLMGCVSGPSAALSKTRELTVPELGGKVCISAIKYEGKTVFLNRTQYVQVTNNAKRIAILSIQMQNPTPKKEYNLSPIVLLDGDKRIEPDAVKYFIGNFAFLTLVGVKSKTFLAPMTIKINWKGPYTINLIYAIDVDKTITRAELFGQVVEFNTDMVYLNVINRFN
jgi:hypothetical protein